MNPRRTGVLVQEPGGAQSAASSGWSRLYGLLAAGFRYPSTELLEALASGSSPAHLRRAAAEVGLSMLEDPPELDGDLGPLYTGLFDVGLASSPPCSLYEGEYGGGRLGVMEDVLRFYRWFGLRLSCQERDRPDHLATELEFLHWLAFQEATASAEPYRAARRDFLIHHALELASAVAERLAQSGASFYSRLARLAVAACAADLAQLRSETALDGASSAGTPPELKLHRLRQDAPAPHTYDLRALRRRPFRWDRVVKSSHQTNCWYQRACNFNLYVYDGVVLREEQVGSYPPPNDPTVPDANPRGCQKGACYAHRTYDPARLKYPLKRAGERGQGRWQRLSWDQALSEIADKLLDALTRYGPQAVIQGGGTRVHSLGTESLGPNAFFEALGSPLPSQNVEIGDDHQGAAITAGKIMFADSADNWLYADIILVWGGNPAYTNIPNYHYISEARYRGAQVIAVSPDYNASAMHADRWLPVNVGSDAALALAMCQVILAENLYQPDFVREQTDLPLLVLRDSGKLLRERDLKRGGRDDLFYVYDLSRCELAQAPHTTLALNGLRPALNGTYQAAAPQGRLTVEPVGQQLRRRLDERYTPEQAAEITGLPAAAIRQLARDVATARGVVNISSSNWGKFYHGDLIERAMLLLFALCGHMGRKGASFSAFPALTPDTAVGALERHGRQMLLSASAADPRFAHWQEDGYTDEMVLYEYAKQAVSSGGVGLTGMVHYVHGGLLDLNAKNQSWDPHLKRPIGEYMRQALANEWQTVVPPAGQPPRVLFQVGGDVFRRGRATQHLMKALLPTLELLVTIDWRMGATALYSDYVLPAAGWYERNSLTMLGSSQSPFAQVSVKAIEPLYESLSEWTIFVRLARALSQRARERGLLTCRDGAGRERRLDRLEEAVTVGGLYDEEDDEGLARDAFVNAGNLELLDWEAFKERGIAAYTSTGTAIRSVGNACDIVPGEPIVPLTWHTQRKQPYPTLTRRLQFYIDHDWYLELDEHLPCHKDCPAVGGDYPLQLTGGHARWSIHSDWIDDALMLALQRGEPAIFLSRADAGARSISDGDTVEVFNDLGAFAVRAVVSPAVRPGQVMVYHAWENYQFPGWRHFKTVMGSPLNPIELAGGYGHIRPDPVSFSPGPNDRGSRIDVRKREDA